MKNFTFSKVLNIRTLVFLSLVAMSFGNKLMAQGVTSANIIGLVLDDKGQPMPGAIVIAKHEPSGTVYGVETRDDGRYTIPAVRIGGPYTLTINVMGFKNVEEKDIALSLGETYKFNATLVDAAVNIGEVTITGASKTSLINTGKTGAGTNIDKNLLTTLPTLSRSFNDFTRLTPQANSTSMAGNGGQSASFSGQDARFNNLTIDGSIFNNGFGLSSGNGGQTGAQPISMDAIDQIQVNVAPYDVRQSGFTGAGINAVTKSGTNNFSVNAFYNTRNEKFVGTKADTTAVNVNNFNVSQIGLSLGAPLIKNKLFIYLNAESERRTDPTVWTANPGGIPAIGNITVVQKADLDNLSTFLKTRFNYTTGEYDNYNLPTQSDKGMVKLDYNVSKNTHASFRFNVLKSSKEILESSSGVVSGSRNGVNTSLNFRSSNYTINNDIYSGIAEINTLFGSAMSNNFQVGYTANRDYRSSLSTPFPTVDIQDGAGKTYISFGYEPFSVDNILNTNTFQIKDDITWYKGNQTITAGLNFESFHFENSFKPRIYGIQTFASLADFYKSAGTSTTNGDPTVILKRYQQTYPAIGTSDIPFAVTNAYQPGIYLQDEVALLKDRMHLTIGVRADMPIFGSTALDNAQVRDSLIFADANGVVGQRFNTSKLPNTTIMFSPRLGLNYDVTGNKKVQLRGGIGIFTGRPAFVWLSNQVGNNGLFSGEILQNNVKSDAQGRPYTFASIGDAGKIDLTGHYPTTAAAATYNLAMVDQNFRFPQLFRANVGLDVAIGSGFVASAEIIYGKTVNNVNYYNANLSAPTGSFSGLDGDNRLYYGTTNPATTKSLLVTNKVTDNTVLVNTDQGYNYTLTGKIERPFKNNLYMMVAYNYGVAKDLMSAGSIANTSWTSIRSVNGNNRPDLAYSDNDMRHRLIATASYKLNEGKFAATTFTIFVQANSQGNGTFTTFGDANGDGISGNDLMYVPLDAKSMVFTPYTIPAVGTFPAVPMTADQQRANFETFINNNEYLSTRRGQYVERNGWVLPWVTNIDFSIIQDFYIPVGAKKHTLQVRMDIYNLTNLINNSWGVFNRFRYTSPLRYIGRDVATNAPAYQFTNVTGYNVNPTNALEKSATTNDVYQFQFGARYSF
jgi:Carboxypeptidase regulatory-like domain